MCKSLFTGLITSLLLISCSVSRTPSLYTHDELIVQPSGTSTRFIYHFYWVLPQSELNVQQRHRVSGSRNTLPPPQRHGDLNRQSADGELKLRLEDAAIVRLGTKLNDQDVCANGHTIDHVRWFERKMEIYGKCVKQNTQSE